MGRLDHVCGIYGALSADCWESMLPAFLFLFRGSKLPESKSYLNGSKPPPQPGRYPNNTKQTEGKARVFKNYYFLHVALRAAIFEPFL